MKKQIARLLLLLLPLLTACSLQTPPEDIPPQTQPTISQTPVSQIQDPPQIPAETSVEIPTEPVIFSPDITFTWEFVRSDDHMPYALFTPSCAGEEASSALIVWLHGRGECNSTEGWFMQMGLPQVMQEWTLEGFNAYVLCPQLAGQWNPGYWNNDTAAGYLRDLVDYFLSEYNIDPSRVILAGFSAGGLGAMYTALSCPELFSKLVVMSSLPLSNGDITQITIPTVGFSELEVSYNSFMKAEFLSVFGENSVRYYDVPHIDVPAAAFTDDSDGNHRSDLVEWMLTDP